MIYLAFDPEPVTIDHFIAGFLPQMGDVATAVGCHKAMLARATAVKLFAQGWRTSTLNGMRIAHRVDNPIPEPLDDDPAPGSGMPADLHGRAA